MKANRIGQTDLIISIDDASPLNLRVAEDLKKLGLIATFFIPTMHPGAEDQIRAIAELGHALGGHTLTHPGDLKAIPLEEARSEIQSCKRQIENWTGNPCEVFAYPRGRFNDDVVELVKNAGFTEARTTHVLRTAAEDLFKTPTTIHVFDGRKEYDGRPWNVMAAFYWGHVRNRGGYFHIWGHADEMFRQNTYDEFIKFLTQIAT